MPEIQSACERVFALPELVQAIIESVILTPENRDLKHSLHGQELTEHLRQAHMCSAAFNGQRRYLGTLATCACVCRAWFREAIPLLWAYCTDVQPWRTMESMFEALEPCRRQRYADHMLRGSLLVDDVSRECPGPVSTSMEGLVFPRLSGIDVEVCDTGGTLPPFAAPNLGWVRFDPAFDCWTQQYGTTPDVWLGLFEQVVVSQNERAFDKKENEYRPNGLHCAGRDDFQLCGISLL